MDWPRGRRGSVGGRTTRGRALGAGLLYGLALWLATEFFFLPVLNPTMALRPGVLWPWVLGYLSFGAMLGALVPATVEVDEEPERERHPRPPQQLGI